jgi:hypothetical protein
VRRYTPRNKSTPAATARSGDASRWHNRDWHRSCRCSNAHLLGHERSSPGPFPLDLRPPQLAASFSFGWQRQIGYCNGGQADSVTPPLQECSIGNCSTGAHVWHRTHIFKRFRRRKYKRAPQSAIRSPTVSPIGRGSILPHPASAMQLPTSVYESALRHNHQHRTRRRRIARLGNAKPAIPHSRSATACGKTNNKLSDQCRQHVYSSEPPKNHGPGANHHSGISRKAIARIIDFQPKIANYPLPPEPQAPVPQPSFNKLRARADRPQ